MRLIFDRTENFFKNEVKVNKFKQSISVDGIFHNMVPLQLSLLIGKNFQVRYPRKWIAISADHHFQR